MVNPFNADAIASTVVDIVIKKQIFDFLLEVAKVGWWLLMIERTNVRRDERYQRTQMQKEAILDALRAKGLRITKQRKIILDIILGEDCSCCKEIYFQASKIDKKIGAATVYRMVNTLEDLGAIKNKNMYRVECDRDCSFLESCCIEFDDNTSLEVSTDKLHKIICSGLRACGYSKNQNIRNIRLAKE